MAVPTRRTKSFPGGAVAKNPETQETWVQSRGQEDPLEKETATHSSILAWKIPRTEEPDGLQSMGSQSQTRLSMHAHDQNWEVQRVRNVRQPHKNILLC